jgi:hypothetical protein
LPPILAQFSNLRSLTLFSKNKSDALQAAASARTLATAWHAACSSLESVTLAGTTLVHNRCYGGWVTLRELAELRMAREKSVQHRAGELCKREVALEDGRQMHGLSPELCADREGSASSVVAITA